MTEESRIFRGCMPALMTPCQTDGSPHSDALVSKARELIDLGMRAVVYCGSMGDWPLLTDAQRQEGVRRLVEAGVKLVTVYWHSEKAGVDSSWDTHQNNFRELKNRLLPSVDRPLAALFEDLESSGLLDETLIVWSGEFGRTPMNEERNGSKLLGRDHHPHCFTVWMAGGGAKRGAEVGATDELGYFIADNKVPVHDLQATMLHLLGLDHEQLTYRFQGREFRLTDVFGNVRSELIA